MATEAGGQGSEAADSTFRPERDPVAVAATVLLPPPPRGDAVREAAAGVEAVSGVAALIELQR